MDSEEASRQVSELGKLTKKLKRYWKRLAREALSVVKEQGLELVVTDDLSIKSSPNQIVVRDFPDGLEDKRLLDLAKTTVPSLYRRFQEYMNKYDNLRIELTEKLSDL